MELLLDSGEIITIDRPPELHQSIFGEFQEESGDFARGFTIPS